MQNRKPLKNQQRNNTTASTSTSWGKVASWYDEYLQDEDTYQARVIAPNLLRLLNAKEMTTQDRVLELGCGQGFFVKEILKVSTPQIEGIDIGQELLDIAKKNNQQAVFTRASASDLSHIKDQSIDIVYSVLALQNMSDLDIVMKEVKRILKTDGKLIAVLNHPAFRVPKQSDWYFSPDRKIQGRVVYTYMSDQKFSIDMHPGRTASGAKKEETFSFHHPLQYYVKLFNKYNFGVSRLEEWISHKTSEEGPKKRAEDQARKEIPLFMALEIKAFLA